MARQPTVLGDVTFRTKGDAVDYVRAILRRADRDGPRRVADATEASAVQALFARHHKHPDAAAIGIAGFETWRDPFGSVGFRAVLATGARVVFSYKTAFDGVNPWQEVTRALREAVAEQVFAWKNAWRRDHAEVRCAVSGDLLVGDDFHADHVTPFSDLVAAFVPREDLVRVALVDGRHGIGKVLADAELAARWQACHAERATFQPLSARENSAKQAARARDASCA